MKEGQVGPEGRWRGGAEAEGEGRTKPGETMRGEERQGVGEEASERNLMNGLNCREDFVGKVKFMEARVKARNSREESLFLTH